MALRCSLIGHDYGEPEVEREREERGREVVVTVEEFERCRRCNEKHVISENTEVTSLSPGSEPADAADAGPDGEPVDPDEASVEDRPGAEVAGAGDDAETVDASDDAELIDAGSEEDRHGPTDAEDERGVELPVDERGEPIVDDGEILEDEGGDGGARSIDTDRDHGEWPDSDDVGPPVGSEEQPTAWPESESRSAADAGTEPGSSHSRTDATTDSVEPVEGDDAVFLDDDPEAERDHPATTPSEHDSGSGTGITSAQSAPAPGEGKPPEGVPTEFHCPRCDFVAPGDRGSLRAGDICPECRKGYLSERER